MFDMCICSKIRRSDVAWQGRSLKNTSILPLSLPFFASVSAIFSNGRMPLGLRHALQDFGYRFYTGTFRLLCTATLDTGSTLGPLDYSVLLQSTVPFGLGLDLNLEKDFESIMIWALFCNNRPSSHWHFPSLPPMTYLFTCRDGMHMSKAYSRDGSRQSPTRSLSALEPTWNTMRFKPHFKRNLSLFQTNCRALYCDVKGWQCKPSAEFKRRAQSWSFPGRGDSDSKEAAPSSRAQPSHQ